MQEFVNFKLHTPICAAELSALAHQERYRPEDMAKGKKAARG
jgi:hypothetical protein